ncbi:hypothetical protein DL89DRAFT_293988 [Linderina pennispora]|uniref:Pentacotripeptide-repeat region of PRORP domain-containing protein n=1 Tax=Linderina pennispora TaxID=61395 RepID=A0A1Y1W607_9FUNG|nr:uncharacterized protein DL89DRAFT_293988 [Linderina pennispora]ORX68795.1 hypothetical protein DL89DRAFT_293988 [Linderina pennispora]
MHQRFLAKALAQYKKIRVSSNSQQLIPQIRPTYAILLITELNFSRSSLYYSSRFDLIIQIYDDFARMGSPITDTLAFSLYLRALNERGMHRQVFTAIENYNKLPGTTTKDVLSAAVIRQLLAAYFGAGRPDKAVELFDMLRTSDAHRSGYLNNGELLALVDELLDLLITSKTPAEQHIGVLNQLLQIAGLSSNYDFLFAALEKFLARKVAISYTTFAILLKVHAQIQPDVSHMLNLYRLITSHKQAQSMMTTPVFSAFIDYFSVLEDLRQHPIAQPNMRTVGLLMARYGKAGLMDRALSLYHRIGFEQFDSLLVDIIHQGRANNYSGMFSAFSELRLLAPTSMMPLVAVLFQSSNIARKRVRAIQNGPMAITRLGAGFPTDAEFELFTANFRTCVDDLLSSSENGLPVKQFLFNMAISISAQIRDYDTTQRVYDYLAKTEGMEPTAQTFRALIRSYISSFDYAGATDVLDELATRNVPLSCITFNALIHGFIAAGLPEQAIKAYSFMAPEFKDFLPVTRPDIYTFATMADGLVSAGMFKEAIVVFEDSFTLLSYVPRQLLETLVSSLEEKMQFDLSQICLKRFGRRIEESQPAEVQVATSDGKQIAMAETPADKLPLSYFGYLLQRSRRM